MGHPPSVPHAERRCEHMPYPCDPLTTLAAVAGLSDKLELLTVVMNSQWLHPGLLLRQFTQLAVLVGGERVTAVWALGGPRWSSMQWECTFCPQGPARGG